MTTSAAPPEPTPVHFTIREAIGSDSGFLYSLAPRLSGVPRPPWHDLPAMEAFQARFMDDTLGTPADGAVTYLAVSTAGVPLGYVHALPGEDGVTGEACGYVAIIAVTEMAEGTGVAAALMAQAENWARQRGYRFLSLDAFAGNSRALAFYRRAGFQPETIRLVKSL
jgi:GNAT superfamily N-acetyltransferase